MLRTVIGPAGPLLAILLITLGLAMPGHATAQKAVGPNPAIAPGALDAAFGSNYAPRRGTRLRTATTAVGGKGLAVHGDGRMVVVADELSANVFWAPYFSKIKVTRFLADGRPDPAFGTAGVVRVASAGEATGIAIAIQPDGKYLVTGYRGNVFGGPGAFELVVVRLNANGTPDATFGTGGTTVVNGESAVPGALLLRPDGRILVTASAFNTVSGRYEMAVLAYNPDGSADITFGDAGALPGVRTGRKFIQVPGYVNGTADAIRPYFGSFLVGGTVDANTSIFGGATTRPAFTMVQLTAQGDLDAAWGSGGIATIVADAWPTESAASLFGIDAIEVLSDFKVLAMGTAQLGPFKPAVAFLMKFDGEGRLDATFGGAGAWVSPGVASTSIANHFVGRGLLVDATSGKLVVPGATNFTEAGFAVFEANGAGGAVQSAGLPALQQNYDVLSPAVRDASGAILMTGVTGDAELLLAKFTVSGSGAAFAIAPDPSLQGTGWVQHFFPVGAELGAGVAVRPGNSIVSVGAITRSDGLLAPYLAIDSADGKSTLFEHVVDWPAGPATWAAVTAVGAADYVAAGLATQADGSLVAAVSRYGTGSAFPSTTVVTAGFGAGTIAQAAAVAVQADGKIVIAGRARPSTQFHCYLERFNADGTIDSAFATATSRLVLFEGVADTRCSGLAVQADGKIVVGGVAPTVGKLHFARFNADGTPDVTFGGDGRMVIATPVFTSGALVVQPDGRIAMAVTALSGTRRVFAVARLTANGLPDPAFGTGGLATFAIGEGNASAPALLVDDFGRLVLGGSAVDGGRLKATLVRVRNDGSLDTTFGTGGVSYAAPGFASGSVNALAAQSTGAIVGAGQDDNHFLVARFHSRGASTLAIVPPAGPVPAGTSITLNATIAGTGLGGTVAFRIASVTIAGCGAVPVLAGTANCTFTTPAVPGTVVLDALYSGDDALEPASSAPVNLVVNAAVLVSVARAGTGSGTVTSTPAGIDCGATCSANFAQGTTATLTAAPAAGHTFTGWSGLCSGTGTCVLSLNTLGTRQVTATFAAPGPILYTLTVAKSGAGTGTVASTSPLSPTIDCGATCAADFNNGVVVSLAATPAAGSAFTGWTGCPAPSGNTCAVTMNAAASVTAGFALAKPQTFDFGGDGKSDLLWLHQDGRVAIWQMNGAVLGTGSTILAAGTGWFVAQVADFNGDGKMDLLWQHPDGRAAIWLMNGLVPLATQQILNAGGGWSAVHAVDLNGDGKADIVWQNTNGSTAVWLMNGTAMTAGSTILGAGTGWSVAKTGDFDGDGKADLLWQHTDGRAAIWLMNGNAVKSTAQILNAGGGWSASHTADLNGDGKADILWKNTNGTIAAWLMNGTTMSSGTTLMGAGTGWSVTRAGDFDGNGKADLFWQHTDGRAAIWLMNGLSPSGTQQLLGAGGGWSAARLADLNGDGKADIVWQNTNGTVAVWLMNGTVTLSGGTLMGAGSGWSVSGVSQ